MKLVIIFFFSGFVLSAQNNLDYEHFDITYKNTYYHKSTSSTPRIEQAKLYVWDKMRIFQADKKRILDSLKYSNLATDEDRSTYFTRNNYVIEIHENSVKYYDEVGNYAYYYEEVLNHDWVLGNEKETINGFVCRDASVTYAGRKWTAWYSPTLPINAGPYKFQGLPGLIIKVYDTGGLYDFEVTSVVKKKKLRLSRYPVFNSTLDVLKTDRMAFNTLKTKWEALSLNERMSIMQGANKREIILTNNNGSDLDMNALANRRVSNLNYLEIDHIK